MRQKRRGKSNIQKEEKYLTIIIIGINLNKSSNTITKNRLSTLIKILRLSNWINEKLKL